MSECVLYHKRLPGMPLEEGYIGISKHFDQRQQEHERAAHVLHSPYEVHHQMRLNKGVYETEIIDEGSREDMSHLEFELRPRWHMAWNMAPGGGNIAGYWEWPEAWLCYRLWHPDHGEVHIGPGFNAADHGSKFFPDLKNSRQYTGNILRGTQYEYRGWELADAQLSQRVRNRLSSTRHGYLSNNIDNISVHPNGQGKAVSYMGLIPGKVPMSSLLRGVRPTLKGWHLISEEEYNANPGPVFGTPESEDE